jgi:short-subunit dehydrogenase
MAPNVGQIVSTGARTVRAFGRRVPGAGQVLAPSLADAVHGRNILITGASSGIGQAAALKIGEAGGTVILVARGREKLEETAQDVRDRGGTAHVEPCDLSEPEDIDRMAAAVLESYGVPDVLVNNAGRSIRRSVRRSYERFHDYQRTMQLNYFGAVKLILDVLPGMRERGSGHIINISTMGLQTNTPRYSAYLASKAALDAFSRSIGAEIIDDGVHITTIYMPLVRTPMIAPTKIYDRFPTLSAEEAAGMITEAIRRRPKRITTALGSLGQLTYAVAPGAQDLVVNRAVKLFPESGESSDGGDRRRLEQDAFARATRGVHW